MNRRIVFGSLLLFISCSEVDQRRELHPIQDLRAAKVVESLETANLYDRLTSELDTTIPVGRLFLSVFTLDDCLMCYSAINSQFENIIERYGISQQAVVFGTPGIRPVALPALFSKHLNMTQDRFAYQVKNKELLQEIRDMATDNNIPFTTSFFIIVEPDGSITHVQDYKSLAIESAPSVLGR